MQLFARKVKIRLFLRALAVHRKHFRSVSKDFILFIAVDICGTSIIL